MTISGGGGPSFVSGRIVPLKDTSGAQGRAMGQGAEQAGRGFVRVAEILQDRIDEAWTKEQLAHLSEGYRELLTSPEGYLYTQGKGSVDGREKVLRALDEKRSALMEAAGNETQRELFAQHSASSYQRALELVDGHYVKQSRAWEVAGSKARAQAMGSDMVETWFAGSPETFESEHRDLFGRGGELDALFQAQGIHPDEQKNLKQEASDRIYGAIVARLMKDNPSGAREKLAEWRKSGRIGGDMASRLDDELRKVAVNEESLLLTKGLFDDALAAATPKPTSRKDRFSALVADGMSPEEAWTMSADDEVKVPTSAEIGSAAYRRLFQMATDEDPAKRISTEVFIRAQTFLANHLKAYDQQVAVSALSVMESYQEFLLDPANASKTPEEFGGWSKIEQFGLADGARDWARTKRWSLNDPKAVLELEGLSDAALAGMSPEVYAFRFRHRLDDTHFEAGLRRRRIYLGQATKDDWGFQDQKRLLDSFLADSGFLSTNKDPGSIEYQRETAARSVLTEMARQKFGTEPDTATLKQWLEGLAREEVKAKVGSSWYNPASWLRENYESTTPFVLAVEKRLADQRERTPEGLRGAEDPLARIRQAHYRSYSEGLGKTILAPRPDDDVVKLLMDSKGWDEAKAIQAVNKRGLAKYRRLPGEVGDGELPFVIGDVQAGLDLIQQIPGDVEFRIRWQIRGRDDLDIGSRSQSRDVVATPDYNLPWPQSLVMGSGIPPYDVYIPPNVIWNTWVDMGAPKQ